MMRRRVVGLLTVGSVVAGLSLPALAARPQRMETQVGPELGVVQPRGAHNGSAKPTSSVNMSYHGGTVMTASNTYAIFWGTTWPGAGSTISGLDTWYGGFGGSNYAAASDEYSGSNGQVTTASTYNGHIVDTTAAPSGSPSTTAVLNEVLKYYPTPSSDGFYAVYVDTPRGNANYCAWHSWATVNGTPTQFAFFFNLTNDPGCDVQDTVTGHPQNLASLGNVSGHELSEARTDPQGNGWFDRQGSENGDKCAWTYGAPYVTFSDKTKWKIQGEWSNAAFTSGSGYPNNSGQHGCLSGA